MTTSPTVLKLAAILNEKFHPSAPPCAQSTTKSLGLDSLDVINFLFSVEEELGVAISDEVIAERKLSTLADFASYIDEQSIAAKS